MSGNRLRPVVALAIVALFGAHAAWVTQALGGGVVDDAFISFRYAANLVTGHGLVFNLGEYVEGYTNFGWTLLAVLVMWVGAPVETVLVAVGVACGIGVVVLTHTAVRSLSVDRGPIVGAPAATVAALCPGLAYYAPSGLETALFALLLGAAGWMLVAARHVGFAVLVALAFLVRPEAGLLGVIGTGVMLARAHRAASWRSVVVSLASMAAIVGPYLVFKAIYFGALVPNTALAKPAETGRGLAYLLDHAWGLAPLFVVAVAGWWSGRARSVPLLVGLWSAYAVSIVAVGGDWMPAGRLFVPILPWLAIAAELGGRELVRRGSGIAAIAGGLVLATPYVVWASGQSLSVRQTSRVRAEYNPVRERVARSLVDNGARSVGTFDIGLVGYRAPELRVLDLGGLTDRTVARSPGLHARKRISDDYLLGKAPDAWLFTSRTAAAAGKRVGIVPLYPVEGDVMSRPWFRRLYRYAGRVDVRADYQLHVFVRRAPRPSSGI